MGFGGGSDKAQKEAAKQNEQQQADIQNAITGINSIFDDPARQDQYKKLGADTTAYYTNDVNDQEAINARQRKFAMARSGLTGGSQDAFTAGQLEKDYEKGILEASKQGQSAEANLKSQDEQSRMSLIAAAESGLDAGTAAAQGTQQLASNLQSASAGSTANTIANAFGDLSNLYTSSQNQKALQQGTLFGYGGLFSSPNYGGPSSGASYGP